MTVHTSALDHALAESLHTADRVEFHVTQRTADGTPTMYKAVAWKGTNHRSARAVTAADALSVAIGRLTTAMGGAE